MHNGNIVKSVVLITVLQKVLSISRSYLTMMRTVKVLVFGVLLTNNPKFNVGDILKAAGWKTPALNKARGNILEGYNVLARPMRIYNPDYLI